MSEQEVTPFELAETLAQVVTGRTSHVRSAGRFGTFEVQLPNGQIYRVQVEELDS